MAKHVDQVELEELWNFVGLPVGNYATLPDNRVILASLPLGQRDKIIIRAALSYLIANKLIAPGPANRDAWLPMDMPNHIQVM